MQSSERYVLAATVLGSSMAFIDNSVVNVALPRMESDLNATLAAMTWVSNAYTLCLAALLLIGGAMADQLGRRRIFVCGLVLFAVASLGCGLATDVMLLILARAVQGVGAAMLIPCSLAIIGATFDTRSRGHAIGIWSGASAIAAGGGPLLGGWLVDHLSWRAIFLINPVLAIPTMLIALRRVPESRDPQAVRGLDWTGALAVFAGLGLLVYGLIDAASSGWGSPAVVAALLAGVVLLAAFIFVERNSAAPMMPLNVFHSRQFSGINLQTLLLYGALGGTIFFLPFLFIQVHDYTATEAGASFLPFTVILGLLSRWGGGLVNRCGARLPLVIGPTLVAVGFGLMAWLGGEASYVRCFLLPITVTGLGMAITVAPLTTTVLNAVEQHRSGVASGINNAVSQVAGLLFIAVLSTVSLTILNQSLSRRAAAQQAPSAVQALVDKARGGLVMPDMADAPAQVRAAAETIIRASFLDSIRVVMLIAGTLAFLSALVAAATISPAIPHPPSAPATADQRAVRAETDQPG
jgi:EmrB/QacA subfamily drug resistance transporter